MLGGVAMPGSIETVSDFTPEELEQHRRRGRMYDRLSQALAGAEMGDAFVSALMLAICVGNQFEKPMDDANIAGLLSAVRDQLNDWQDNHGKTLAECYAGPDALPMAPGVH